jgi:hypothetical protein
MFRGGTGDYFLSAKKQPKLISRTSQNPINYEEYRTHIIDGNFEWYIRTR